MVSALGFAGMVGGAEYAQADPVACAARALHHGLSAFLAFEYLQVLRLSQCHLFGRANFPYGKRPVGGVVAL